MNFYGTTTGPQHTLFGRVVPMMEAMRQAIYRAAEQPVPLSPLAHDLPPWVPRIADELTCTVFKGIVNLTPAAKKYNARKHGQLVGLLLRLVLFYWKEASAFWEREGLNQLTPEQSARFEKATGWEVACVQASQIVGRPITTKKQLRKFWRERLGAFALRTGKTALALVNHTLHQPVEDIFQFMSGLPEGFKCFLRPDGEFAKRGKRTEVYFALLTYWPEIEEIQQAQPPLTRRFLLEWLEKQEGKPLVESEKIFLEICGDIGLDVGVVGHPTKIPPS